MKKLLSALLALCMLLSVCGALAEVTQEDIDTPYDPPINLTAWRFLSSAIQFENGDTIEKNIYIDRFLSDLCINLTYDWVVAEEQFDQKMNVSIVSGDLHDLMWLKAAQLKELAQEGELYDLTDLFDKYANQYAKDTLMADMKQFDTAKVDGRLYAIPHTASSFDSLGVLFIRTDWLAKLGLEEPTTLAELEKCGAKYYDQGKEKDVLAIMKEYGVDTIRLKLWNDPFSESGESYGAGGNDLDTDIYIGKKVTAAGMGVLLNFHYSDFWVDPGKQYKPKAWRTYSVKQLEKAVSELSKLMRAEGFLPNETEENE